MKVADLRAKLKNSSPDVLTQALVEVYKEVPKAKKEELDPVLEDILAGVQAPKTPKKQPTQDLGEVMNEIDEFLSNAKAGYYLAPNRVVAKKERPKWRFHVMRFIKALKTAEPVDPNYAQSGEYLLSLFQLLAYGCMYYTFSSDDTFASIQTPQEELFSLVAARMLECQGCNEETLATLFWTAASCGVSRTCLNRELIAPLIDLLQTEEEKRLALKTVKQLIADHEEELPNDGPYYYDHGLYTVRDGIRELDRAVIWIASLLGEMEDEMVYYFKHGHEKDREISLYCALDLFQCFDWYQEWVTLYEYAVGTLKIKPRDRLQETYPTMKKLV